MSFGTSLFTLRLSSSFSSKKSFFQDKITNAILYDLPELLEKFQTRLPLCVSDASECTLEDKKFVPKKKEKKKAH
jgi:hypothetical protein